MKQRDYWNIVSDDFKSIYTKEKIRFLVLLDKIFRKDMFERFEFTIENCKPVEGNTYLDIGSGTGLFSIELAKLGAEKVIGLDISEKMIDISRKEARNNNVEDKCSFIHTDLLEYNSDCKINISFGIGLFDYIRDAQPVVSRMYAISENRVIFSFPRLFTWRMPIRKLRLALKGCEVFFYSRKKVVILLKNAGFKDYKIKKIGKLHCVVGYKN